MLQSAFDERQLTAEETLHLILRMIGGVRDVALLLAREVDKLDATRS